MVTALQIYERKKRIIRALNEVVGFDFKLTLETQIRQERWSY